MRQGGRRALLVGLVQPVLQVHLEVGEVVGEQHRRLRQVVLVEGEAEVGRLLLHRREMAEEVVAVGQLRLPVLEAAVEGQARLRTLTRALLEEAVAEVVQHWTQLLPSQAGQEEQAVPLVPSFPAYSSAPVAEAAVSSPTSQAQAEESSWL